MPQNARWGDVGVGVGTILLALVVAWQTSLISGDATYARVGPQAFPWAVAAMLGALGLLLAAQGFTGIGLPAEEDEPAEARPPVDATGAMFMVLGLALNVALIDWIGFILSSTLLFVCTARAFKSTSLLRDAAIGFLLALVSYIGFDRVLGYKIGSGLIESLI